jgi:uncharacterized protein
MDLSGLKLAPGDVRHERPRVHLEPLSLGGQSYTVSPDPIETRLELQASSGGLYLKLAFSARVEGACFRCLEPASLDLQVRSSEYHDAAASPVFALPGKILCREECAGLCPHCGRRLEPGTDHDCGQEQPDTRWEKLRDLL